MIGFERDGLREQYISRKRDCRRKLKQVAVAYPRLEQELQNTGGLTDGELRRRAKELKKLGREYKECKAKLENKNNERGQNGRDEIVESHRTMNLDNNQVKQMHMERRQNQDDDLDDILKGV